MRFTPYQIIILVAVICGFLLMYTGRAGIDVLLFLCGVALLLAAGVSNRGVVVRFAARGFKFGMNLLPSRKNESSTAHNELEPPDDSQLQLPNREE
ncbi:MAG: hypothetical protein OXG49_01515 [Chloroflexi bacterium]|nr:hypothetical protein [Chloroflexota bacterium]